MKKLLASLLAMSMMFAFTACSLAGDDDDDDSSSKKSKNDTSSSVVDSDEDDSKADEESSEAETQKADDTSSVAEESSSEEESSKDEPSSADESSQTDKPAASGSFQGTGYTIDVDNAKWSDISASLSGVDSAFSYIGDTSDPYLATANFNIISQTGAGSLKPSDYIDVVKQQYETLGYKVAKDEQITFNGYDAYKVHIDMEQSGMTMVMNQIILVENDTLYVLSYGSESSVFDTVEPEFDSVLSTFAVS